jgi:hypothetical protein
MARIPDEYGLPKDESGAYYTPTGTPLERPVPALPREFPTQQLYEDQTKEEALQNYAGPSLGEVFSKGAFLTQERRLGIGRGLRGEDQVALAFQYNPTSVKITRNLDYGSIDTPGSSFPATYFRSAKPDQIEFTLFFEAKSKLNSPTKASSYFDGISKELAALQSLTYSDSVLKLYRSNPLLNRPPKVILSLGPKLTIDVWIKSLGIEIREWSPKLIPLRANVDISVITAGDSKMAATAMWISTMVQDAADHADGNHAEGIDVDRFGVSDLQRHRFPGS